MVRRREKRGCGEEKKGGVEKRNCTLGPLYITLFQAYFSFSNHHAKDGKSLFLFEATSAFYAMAPLYKLFCLPFSLFGL